MYPNINLYSIIIFLVKTGTQRMKPYISSRTESSFKLEIEIPYSTNMLEAEELLQHSLNQGGALATKEMMELHDTDGSPITICDRRLTAKGQESKEIQTPYGAVKVSRYVYQSSKGGKTYVPMDIGCKLINTSTPKFAKIISSKYSCDAAPGVQRDLAENHGRSVAVSFIKNIVDTVGTIAEAKEENWNYDLPEMPNTVKTISVGLDGTCLNMKEDGWREAMCGTIALFDRKGNRMHTIYTSASPEYGKKSFLNKLDMEIGRVIELYPKAPVVGLADGAASNWSFLKSRVDSLVIDFWHVTEYLSKASSAMFPKKKQQDDREEWLESTCHKLKHNVGAATRILNELMTYQRSNKISTSNGKKLQATITYITNNKEKMAYAKHVAANAPIGSGVTEAACKTIVKQRMCKGAARWKDKGATTVLTLRSLHMTNSRWNQFWKKYSQYGCQELLAA